MRERILELIVKNPTHATKMIKNNDLMVAWVVTNTLVDGDFREMTYSAIYKTDGTCQYNKKRRFVSVTQGYKFCGYQNVCMCNKESTIKKSKETCQEKYGVDHYSNPNKTKETNLTKYGISSVPKLQKTKDKMRATCQEKYGVDSTTQIQEIKDKMRATCQEKYGVDHYVHSDRYLKEKGDIIKTRIKTNQERYGVDYYFNRIKAKETNQERYGVDHYASTDEMKEKVRLINQERYGVDYYFESQDFKIKAKETNQERYGVDHYASTDEMKEKVRLINQERYKVDHYSQKDICADSMVKLNNKEWLEETHNGQKQSLAKMSEHLGVDPTTVRSYLIKHNVNFNIYHNQSLPEQLLCDYVSQAYNTTALTNLRTIIPPREIDIWVPEFNLAIEFNGKYWHHPDRYESIKSWLLYHKSKEEECNIKGIQLLHLWEGLGDHKQLIDLALIGAVNNDYTKILKYMEML